MKNRENSQAAFTLIEVMVSMLVLAIGLLGLAGVTVVVLRQNSLTQQISDATNVAADLMENLKRQGLSALPDCNVLSGTVSYLTLPSNCDPIQGSGLATVNAFWPSISNT